MISDSSLRKNSQSIGALYRRDYALRVGMVRESFYDHDLDIVRYLVDVRDRPEHQMLVVCDMMSRFGSPFNYEEWIPNVAEPSSHEQKLHYNVRAGDAVLVAFVNGIAREGMILGGLRHPSRSYKLKLTDGPTYVSEFNGINQSINKDGEYTVTFKGQPTNLAKFKQCLEDSPVPTPTYDTTVGTSYFKFDKNGGWTVSDNATSNPQLFQIDKSGGTVKLTSGSTSITLNKNQNSVSINTSKIAIGNSSAELLSLISQLIDALGTLTPTATAMASPTLPFQLAPQWAQILLIKQKIASITGSL